MKIIDMAKRKMQTWLEIEPANTTTIRLREFHTYESNAIKNMIWYRGDAEEIRQLYTSGGIESSLVEFWGARSTPGQEIRRIHTGIPGLAVDMLAKLTLADLNGIEIENNSVKEEWESIYDDNKFDKVLEKAVKQALYIGDGAFKISFDPEISADTPILEWWSGDKIEIVTKRGRLKEVVFKTKFRERGKTYTLHEICGYGYIKYELYQGDKLEPMPNYKVTDFTANLESYNFDKSIILGVTFKIEESTKWENRGQSIFDRKIGSFDALDEVWSQWIDALRKGRSKEYIPESLIPRNPNTGALMRPNAFDNSFIAIGDDNHENGQNRVVLEQANIPHDSYLATYITALDLALQGIISPSTLGIDTKKLDNAEAQREKEKATLYSRNAIVEALNTLIPELVKMTINAKCEMLKMPIKDFEVSVSFGEYANPSFESQVETVGKGKTQGIMSIEAAVEELYGDTKTTDWKKEEVARLKAEQGISDFEEPAVNTILGDFSV